MKFAPFLFIMLCPSLATAAEGNDSCRPQTPLEKAYCALVAKGAAGLPPLYEFRKNGEPTQHLLLKRPAAKLGVALPNPVKKAKAAAEPDTSARANPPAGPALDSVPRPSTPPPKRSRIAATHASTDCQLTQETIVCGTQRYQLQWNKPKNALGPGALSATNQLVFPSQPKGTGVQRDYLTTCYGIYVHKMLLLGLGNTTMSFSKFAAIYEQAQSQKFDFAARFERMYHFLKEERKTLQPPKGFGHRPPSHLDNCEPINEQLWSCETAEQHWVFART